MILSSLAEGVEVLRALTPSRLAALNHGTVRSPIPGQESQIVLHKCRNWAAQVGELKISDDGPNPVISCHLVGVDTDGILANAQNIDNYGNRIHKARSLFYEQLGLAPAEGGFLPLRYETLWRGTQRTCELLFGNVRELPLESFNAQGDTWRVVVDFPFDRDGHTPRDDLAQLQKFQETGASSHCLVWLPAFFTRRTMEDLGRLVILDYILTGHNLNQCGSHLSQLEREQARILLHNQRDQNWKSRAIHRPLTRLTTSELALPPKPRTFIRMQSSLAFRARIGTKSKSQSGSGNSQFVVGAMIWSRKLRAQAASCNGPPAASGFPVTPLIELIGIE